MDSLGSSPADLLARIAELEAQLVEQAAELQLQRRLNHTLRSITENIPDVIVQLGPDLQARYVSPNFVRYTGLTIDSFFNPAGPASESPFRPVFVAMRQAAVRAFAERTPQAFEFSWPMDDTDCARQYEARVVPEAGPAGAVETVLLIAREVTEQRIAEAALRASVERLHLMLSGMPVMLDAFDENRRLTVWNAECEHVTGYSAAELLGRDDVISLLYPDPEYRAALIAAWQRQGSDFRNWELTLTRKDGTERLISWSNVSNSLPVPGWSFWAVGVDVTEQRRAEAALRASEERLRFALHAGSMFGWELDFAQDAIIWLGDPAVHINRFESHQIAAWLRALVPPDDILIMQQALDNVHLGREQMLGLEYRYLRADGTLGWLESHGQRASAEGEPLRLIGVTRDITRRKRLEAEILQREREFALLLENSPAAIIRYRFAPAPAYEYISPAIERIAGYAPVELLADPMFLSRISHPDDRAVVEALNRIDQVPSEVTLRLFHRDGHLIWVELTITPIYSDDGTLIAFEGILHDISAHKELEQTLRRQSQLHEALAGALRILHCHGYDEELRQSILVHVAIQLRLGLAAQHILMYEQSSDQTFHRLVAIDAAGTMDQRAHSLVLADLPPSIQQCINTGELLFELAAVPIFGIDDRQQLQHLVLPIGWSDITWGLLAIGLPAGKKLDMESKILIRTIVDMTRTTIRRWLAVDALQISERRLRLAIAAAHMGTWDLDIASGEVTISERCAELLMLPSGTTTMLINQGFERLHPDDRPIIESSLVALTRNGEPLRRESRLLLPDGSVRWLLGQGQLQLRSNGTPERLVGVVIDITDQRQAEEANRRLNAGLEQRVAERTSELAAANRALRQEIAERIKVEAALRESQRFVERVLAASPSRVSIFDYATRQVIYSTGTFTVALGYSAEELERMGGPFPLPALIHPDDMAKISAQVQQQFAMADDDVLVCEFRMRHADGTWRWFVTYDVIFSRDDDAANSGASSGARYHCA
ncbi:MAG: PAS domain-containing protein [Oscillochloris sp.]|nr:PAS domain-containing protein [Oscillochloris sp.]